MNNQKPTVAIIGATGATGKYVLQGALDGEYNIKVLARNPSKLSHLEGQIEIIKGSVDDIDTVKKLIEGADALLSTLGTSKKPNYIVEKGVQIMLQAIQSADSKPRFIHMSAVGLGDSKPACKKSIVWSMIVNLTFPLIGRELFADMERAENLILEAEGVNAIIMRAAVLNNKPPRGYKVQLAEEPVGKMFISRQDIAAFMLDNAIESSYDGQSVSLFST